MSGSIRLRPAQEKILQYRSGRMAVSAVPGSGKTFTLVELAARLITSGQINPLEGQQVLIVTYLNSSADNFKTRLREKLLAQDLNPIGYDARTLHSMALEIIRLMHGDAMNMPQVIDEAQSTYFLARAIDGWRDTNRPLWDSFLPAEAQSKPTLKVKWRQVVEKTAKVFIRTAKNEQFRPNQILTQLTTTENPEEWAYTKMFAEIYERYQGILLRQAALDYDDQVWMAVDYVEKNQNLAKMLRHRWPFILEDEAQDSVPLQETLLNALVGNRGNLVRVGDPNQAITSTFTAANPRFLNAFLQRDDVLSLPLPNSGRNAPMILSLANELVDWTLREHPVDEVRTTTFRAQHIEPTPEGDAQPNPPDSEANVRVKIYDHREKEELPDVIRLARIYNRKFPDRTVAILVPTNALGLTIADKLDEEKVDYDNLLRGGTRERQIASVLHSILSLMADPLNKKALHDTFTTLREMEHPAASDALDNIDRFSAVLRSVHRSESLLFPTEPDEMLTALPHGIATPEDVSQLQKFTRFLRNIFELRPLPIDALALALGDEVFVQGNSKFNEGDLAIAYQIANILRGWQDLEPDKRLPDLVAELSDVASGRRHLNLSSKSDDGFEPRPGRITLATQHASKGMEWDAVFLVNIDNYWIPSTLTDYFQGVYDFVGGDPTAQAKAELLYLMLDEDEYAHFYFPSRTPTESAHINIISERLRLLYVGITRAKRFLQISRSKVQTVRGNEKNSDPAAVIGRLARHLANYKKV